MKVHDWPTGTASFGRGNDRLPPEKEPELARKANIHDPAGIKALRAHLNEAISHFLADIELTENFKGSAKTRVALFGNKKNMGILGLAEKLRDALNELPDRGWDWIRQSDEGSTVEFLEALFPPVDEDNSHSLIGCIDRAKCYSETLADGRPLDFARRSLAMRVVLILRSLGIKVTTTHYVKGSQHDSPAVEVLRLVLQAATGEREIKKVHPLLIEAIGLVDNDNKP